MPPPPPTDATSTISRAPRVLSVQSTVVHGYVGNKASMFPLQLLGFDVSPINTVQLSNHTGYAIFTGSRFSGAHLHDLIDGLVRNAVADFDYVLTGYAGNVDLLEELADVLARLKAGVGAGAGTAPRVFCDPVMGDDGVLYVPGEFVQLYRTKVRGRVRRRPPPIGLMDVVPTPPAQIVPLADVLLPNQTEAEFLSETTIASVDDAARACRRLHDLGPAIVIITSVALGRPNSIETFVSERGRGCWRFVVDRIAAVFSGTGDAIAALCLAWMRSYPVEIAVALALATVRSILIRTQAGGGTELLLIQSRDDILNPFDLPQPRCDVYETSA